jgi:hypothetical protein
MQLNEYKRQTLFESAFFASCWFVDHCCVAGALLGGVVPLGLGRKARNSTIEATIMPRMMKNMSGLEKAGLFSGGGVGDSIVVGCKDSR